MINRLTIKQAAKLLGVHYSRVLYFIQAKRLPAERFGYQWLIKPKDLERVSSRKNGRPKKG
jgi:excisionase family DNA binding protein